MLPSKRFFGNNKQIHKDGYREPVRTWITTPARKHFQALAKQLKQPLSRVIGDALERLAGRS